MMISFTVPGRPQPQGSMKRRGAGMTHSNPKLDQWRKDVGSMACGARVGKEWPRGIWPCAIRPFAVDAVFHLSTDPMRPPDVDKLLRGILDALTGVIWADDSQVIDLTGLKIHSPDQRAEIEIRLL